MPTGEDGWKAKQLAKPKHNRTVRGQRQKQGEAKFTFVSMIFPALPYSLQFKQSITHKKHKNSPNTDSESLNFCSCGVHLRFALFKHEDT